MRQRYKVDQPIRDTLANPQHVREVLLVAILALGFGFVAWIRTDSIVAGVATAICTVFPAIMIAGALSYFFPRNPTRSS